MQPDISLVICTRNRASQLRRCLEYVASLDWPPTRWELVIVDNGSTDDTPAVCSEFAALAPMTVVTVREQRPGLGRARNAGTAAANAQIVVTTDDDCYPAADFLAQVMRVFEDGGVGLMTGRILLHDPTDAAITIRESTENERYPAGSFIEPGQVHGANLAYRKRVWEDVRGFDDEMGAGTRFGCEDIDFAARVLHAGWHGVYDAGAVVEHHHGRKPGRDERALARTYAYSRGAYFAKCVLDREMRMQTVAHWISTRLRPSGLRHPRSVVRELLGAVRYVVR